MAVLRKSSGTRITRRLRAFLDLLSENIRRVLLYPAVPPDIIESALSSAIQHYAEWRNADGGWPSEPGACSSSWSTAQAVYLLTSLNESHYKEEIEDAVRWLLAHRHRDHGWGLEHEVSDVTGTELALYALSRHHSTGHMQQLRQGADWLIAKQNPADNGWAFAPRNTISSVYCTTWAIISLLAANETLRNPIIQRVHVQRGKKFLTDAQSDDGRDPGWGKFHKSPTEGMRTAYALNGLLAVGARKGHAFRRGLRALKIEQQVDGGWGDDEGSNIEGTAWAIVALLKIGCSPLTRTVRRGVSFLLKTRIPDTWDWPERPEGPAQVWCTHHAIVALDAYARTLRPLYQVALPLLAGRRLKARIVDPVLRLKYRWLYMTLCTSLATIGVLSGLGILRFGPVTSYISAHAGAIAIIAAALTVGNIVAVTVRGVISGRRAR